MESWGDHGKGSGNRKNMRNQHGTYDCRGGDPTLTQNPDLRINRSDAAVGENLGTVKKRQREEAYQDTFAKCESQSGSSVERTNTKNKGGSPVEFGAEDRKKNG